MISRIAVFMLALVLLPIGTHAMESAESRKAKTEKFLAARKVPINKHLPLIEDAKHARFRSAQEVAKRIVILYNVAALGHGIEKNKVIDRLKKSGVWDSLAPSEKSFIESSKPTQQQVIDATWRVEALWALLWALGKVDALEFPTKACDMDKLHSLMPKPDAAQAFIASARLREPEKILDETDMIYRIHWAVRDAQLQGKPIPAKLEPGVVVERHYALNWLTWYADEWDDITTDT